MFVSRCCSIGFYLLLNLNVLCRAQGQGQRQRPVQMQSDGLNFGFPEAEEEDPSRKNSMNKTPVYVANRCNLGEILYPGDQHDDWVCDCKPAYLYYPTLQQCYHAYTKGPCRPGEYLVLPVNSVVPECRRNPCRLDNFVPFRNECYELDKVGPCMFPELSNVVGVNETTLEIICTKDARMNLATRISGDDNEGNKTMGTTSPILPEIIEEHPIVNGTIYLKKRCFVGGRRWAEIKCPEQDYANTLNNKNYNNNYNTNNANNNPNSDLEIKEKIDQIFTIPSSA